MISQTQRSALKTTDTPLGGSVMLCILIIFDPQTEKVNDRIYIF